MTVATRARRTAWAVLRDRWTGIAAILLFWTGVGLVAALQRSLAVHLGGGGVALSRTLVRGLVAGLPWVPLTLAIAHLARRFPPGGESRRNAALPGDPGTSATTWPGRGLARSLCVHLAACLALPFVYNLAFWLLWRPGYAPALILRTAVRTGLENLHLVVATYWAIVAAEGWRARLLDGDVEEARGGGASEPEGDSPPEGGSSSSRPEPLLTVRSGRATEVVPAGHVAWIEGAGDYARLHTDDGAFLSSATLKELANRLSGRGFLRIHRSTIVNLERLRSYRPRGHGDYTVSLDDGTELRVSRSRGRAFRRRVES